MGFGGRGWGWLMYCNINMQKYTSIFVKFNCFVLVFSFAGKNLPILCYNFFHLYFEIVLQSILI